MVIIEVLEFKALALELELVELLTGSSPFRFQLFRIHLGGRGVQCTLYLLILFLFKNLDNQAT